MPYRINNLSRPSRSCSDDGAARRGRIGQRRWTDGMYERVGVDGERERVGKNDVI